TRRQYAKSINFSQTNAGCINLKRLQVNDSARSFRWAWLVWLGLGATLPVTLYMLTGGRVTALSPPAPPARPPAKSSPLKIEDGWTRLHHDFGVNRPGQRVLHRFPIVNTGDRRWTFSGFSTSCSCAVSEATANVVEPGSSEEVEVVVTLPQKVGDVR